MVQAMGVAIVAALLSAVLLTVSTLLIVYQEKLLYIPVVMGYKTILDNPAGYRSPAEHGHDYKDFYLKTSDGESIHGWHIHRDNPVATIIFCHENAGNIGLRVTNLIMMAQRLNCDLVAFDYRGYGHSSGIPSEAGLLVDTHTVYHDYVLKQEVQRKVILYGRSLGGAVAVQFAAQLANDKRIAGVIIENTFTSIANMLGSVFPFLNFGLVKKFCLRLKWETEKWIEHLQTPILLISGLKDEIVPASHMMRLKSICEKNSVKHTFVSFPDGTHNDTWVVGGEAYWKALALFVSDLVAK